MMTPTPDGSARIDTPKRLNRPTQIDPRTCSVGCIGLGAMGGAMARNLSAGCAKPVLAYDLSSSNMKAAVAAGCSAARSLADFSGSDVIVMSLPRSSDCQAVVKVLLKANGLKRGCTILDTTSGVPAISKELGERLEAHQVDYLDFGVAGGPAGAATARLSGMVGGSQAALARVMPVVKLFCNGDAVHHMGPYGAGHAVKAVNNMLLGANIVTATEGLTLLNKFGVPSEAALAAINSSSGRSLVTEERIPNHVLSGRFDFGFRLDLMMKDLRNAIGLMDATDVGGHGAKAAPGPKGAAAPVLREVFRSWRDAERACAPESEHMEGITKIIEAGIGADVRHKGLARTWTPKHTDHLARHHAGRGFNLSLIHI